MPRVTKQDRERVVEEVEAIPEDITDNCVLCSSTLAHIVSSIEARIGVPRATVCAAVAKKYNAGRPRADHVTWNQLDCRIRYFESGGPDVISSNSRDNPPPETDPGDVDPGPVDPPTETGGEAQGPTEWTCAACGEVHPMAVEVCGCAASQETPETEAGTTARAVDRVGQRGSGEARVYYMAFKDKVLEAKEVARRFMGVDGWEAFKDRMINDAQSIAYFINDPR
jgi:hypothetical protein